MRAVYLPGDRRVEIREVAIPEVGVGDVLIEVKASCICRSDLSLYYGNPVVGGGSSGQKISGHEPAGIVAKTGPGVRKFRVGDRVAVYLAVGCGLCAYCRMGNFHLCAEWTCLGFTADGGNAEYLVVPERNCLAIPNALSFVAAAISTDAFGTLFSACRKLGLSGASTVGIWGLGPMGSSGILAAKAFGARVVALDPIAERRTFANSLGADLTLDPTDSKSADALRAFAGGVGLTAAVDCSGNAAAQNMALDAVMPLGKVAFVGEAAETAIRPSEQLIRKQVTLIGSWYFGVNEYDEIARTIVAKKIDLERLATHRFSLDEAETAFRMFDQRKTEKAVFVMEERA
jgi:propanol-preferring alcohol dehydrogenase